MFSYVVMSLSGAVSAVPAHTTHEEFNMGSHTHEGGGPAYLNSIINYQFTEYPKTNSKALR